MESLSIKKTGKVFLAVALVIFMLVALLGLSLYGHTAAAASADTPDLVVAAAFTASSATAHTDSTTTKKYYNQLASGTGALPLAVNDTFTVTYSFTVNNANFTGAKYLTLTNTGFDIVSVTVNSVNLTTGSGTTTTSNGVYTMSADKKSVIGFDGAGNVMAAVDDIVVVYKLTEAIDTYANKTIGLSGEYSVLRKKLQAVASSTVAVYVRSTTSITTSDPSKTYDATAVTTSTTFTPAVSDASDTSNRSAIVTTWSAGSAPIDAGNYNVAVSTAANDYYEASAYNTDFTIAQRAVTITADAKTSVYSTSPVALSYTYSESGAWSNFDARDSITVSYSGAGASISTATEVGSYTITPSASGTGIGNYDVTAVNGTYTVTRHHVAVPTVTIYNNGATTDTTIAAGTTEEKTFNGKAYTFNYTAASADANSIVPFGATGGDAITNVGTSTLTLTLNENYYWGAEGVAVGSQDTAAKTFTIQVNKAEITVTLHHAAIEYLDAVPTADYYITAAVCLFDEDVSTVVINQADFSTEYTVGDGVGTYDIALANTNGSKTAIEAYLSNYNVSYTGEDQLTVGKKTINVAANWIDWATGDSATMTYDAAAHGIVAVPANYTYASTAICNVAFSGGDSAEGAKQTHVSGNEAAVTLTATFSLKTSTNDGNGNLITDNYNLVTNTTSKDITIERYAVTITADDKSTIYGTVAPAFTTNAAAQLLGSDEWTTAGSCTSAYTAAAGNDNRVVGTYDIVPSGWANNDYAISYTNGTLTVSKKTVSITWSATKSWVYDATSHTITATIGDTEYSEDITVTVYGGTASATDVGNYTRSVTTLSDMANYALPADVDEDYSITQAPITITITPATSLVYTSADKTVFTVTVSGMIGTETLTYTFDGTNLNEADGTFTLSNASETFTGMLAQGYGLELTAVANGTGKVANYSYTLPEAAENTIAKATFTPGAISYDGATVSWAAVTGVQGSDVITFTYTVNKGETEKQSSTSTMSYTAAATGADYVLAISFAGDRAANYNAIADQALLEVFSVTFTDTASEHTSEPTVFADVVYYAFSGESVAAHDAWSLQNYTWEGWKYTPSSEEITYDAPALSASLTVRATWAIKTVTVTYKYKLAGKAASTYKTYKTETIYANADLTALPTVKWFAASAWNDAEALNGNTKTNVYYETYASTRTFYTEFTFTVKNGDVDGNGSVTAADATLYRQHNVGGYAVDAYTLADIDAAWAVVDTCTGEGTFADSWWAAEKYFLQAVSDVDASGEEDTNDITYIVNAQVSKSLADIEDDAIVIKLADEEVANDTTIAGFFTTPTAVKVAGADAAYSYNAGTVTLTAALTTGQKLEIIIGRVKYVYTKA